MSHPAERAFHFSLSQKLLMLFLVVTLLPLAVSAGLAYQNARNSVVADVKAQLNGTATIQSERVDEIIAGYLDRTQLLAARKGFTNSLVAGKQPTASSLATINTTLEDAKQSIAGIDSLSILTSTGKIVASTDTATVGLDASKTTYYNHGLKALDFDGIYLGADNGRLARTSGPLRLGNQTVGVIMVLFNETLLQTVTNDYTGLGQSGEVMIVQAIPGSSAAMYLNPLRFDRGLFLARTDTNSPMNTIAQAAISGQNMWLTGKNTIDYRGQHVFAATRGISASGWGLIAKIDQVEALQSVSHLEHLYIASLLLTALVVTILVLVIARRLLIRPLHELVAAATRLKKGDFTEPVHVNSHDEIGELADAFNTMTQQLRNSYGMMKQEVRAATAELAKQLEQSEQQNRQLEDSKQAVLNILDDLNEEKSHTKETLIKDEAVLQGIGEGLIAFNAHGEVERVNHVAEKLLGYSEHQLLGNLYARLVHAIDDSGASIAVQQRPVTQAISSKQTIATTLNYVRRDGSTFPAQLTVAPIVLGGSVVGAIEIFRDITREKEIDKTKTEFVSLASHQLRTPLSTISWYAEMLLAGDAGKITKEQKQYIEEIYGGNRRMTELVGSLLNVSRIELGTFSVEPEPTDLVKLSQTIVKDLEPRIFARKIDFQEQYDPKLPIMNVDPKLMRMVIENLASNAIKYTPESGSVTLKIERQAHEVQLVVSDTGFGIPKSQQDKIFSKLFRADNVKTQDTEGTGLGLYLVKSIVDYSGGKIWFKSEENKGTTFFVSLPIHGMKQKKGSKELD